MAAPSRFAVLVLCFAACAAPKPDAPPVGASETMTRALTGVWKSDGYGFVFAAAGDSLHAFEATQTTCVPSFSAIRLTGSSPGIEATYRIDGDDLLVKPGPDSTEKRLHSDGAASDMVIRRIAALPATCVSPTADTPAGNFEVFVQTWAEHYILFDQKHTDWAAVVAKARAQVTPATTPAQLFAILSGMIAPFEDAHTSISATKEMSFRTLRKGTDRVAKHGMRDFRSKDLPRILAVTERHLRTPLHQYCADQLQFGHLDDSTGYLRILSESGYAKEGGFVAGLVALEAALDTIFTDSTLRGLVLDLRINMGGADPYGLALASRLATSQYVAYSKEARLDPLDRTRWTPGQPSAVTPSSRPGFKGPVVELIGPLTISAGETTTQALMGRSPHVVRIGERTQGVFSDVLGRTMPNGWRFGLPNEVFRASDGTTYDGPGIPPDISAPVFADADLAAGRDPGVTRALAELYRRK